MITKKEKKKVFVGKRKRKTKTMCVPHLPGKLINFTITIWTVTHPRYLDCEGSIVHRIKLDLPMVNENLNRHWRLFTSLCVN